MCTKDQLFLLRLLDHVHDFGVHGMIDEPCFREVGAHWCGWYRQHSADDMIYMLIKHSLMLLQL